MIQNAFGESALSKTWAYEWYKDFKSGRTKVEDLPRPGGLSMSNTDENDKEVRQLVLANLSIILKEIVGDCISYRIAQQIVMEILCMRRVTSRLLSKDLNFVQKQHRR